MTTWESIRPLLFSKEWRKGGSAATASPPLWNEIVEQLQQGHGGAVTSETLRCGRRVRSVAFKESAQLKLEDLPIGARTLLFSDTDVPELLMRGLNKFPDFSVSAGHLATVTSVCATAAAAAASSSASVQSPVGGVHVFLQKKLAGFVIHMFSLDGVTVEVVSKHSCSKWHAQRGRQLLEEVVGVAGSDGDRNFAQALYEGNVVLSCECVDVGNDYQHPILEAEKEAPALIAFSLGVRNSIQELVAPWEHLRSFCTRFGFQVVDTEDLMSHVGSDEWLARLREVRVRLHDWRAAFEGYVLLVEVPLSLMGPLASPLTNPGSSPVDSSSALVAAVVPLRFKMKSNRYRVLRCLRSTILGEHQLSEQHEFYFHPYMAALRAWISDCTDDDGKAKQRVSGEDSAATGEPSCNDDLGGMSKATLVPSLGMWRTSLLFEGAYLAASRKRHRATAPFDGEHNSESIQRTSLGYRELIRCIEQTSLRRVHSPHSLVLLCGLPGSGKSTLAAEVVRHVLSANAGTAFRHVIVLSRDECARESIQASAINAATDAGGPAPPSISKHQQRRQQRGAHELYSRRMALVSQWIALRGEDERTLVILDACHATAESRSHFRALFPEEMRCALCLYVDVSPEVAAARLTTRSDHVILKQDAARGALQEVVRVFRPPTGIGVLNKDFSAVLRCAGDADVVATAALVVRCAAQPGGAVVHVGGSDAASDDRCSTTGSSVSLAQLRVDVVGVVRAAVAVLSPSTALHDDRLEHLLESQSATSARAQNQTAHTAVLVCGQSKDQEDNLQRSLWELSAKSLIAAAVGTRTTAAATTTTENSSLRFPDRVLRWVASRLRPLSSASGGGGGEASPVSSLVDGNVKWIVGKFIERDSRTPLGPEHYDALLAGLQQRYAGPKGAPPHVTIAHAVGPSSKSDVTRAAGSLGLVEGQCVTVRLTHLVLDDWAIGFVATATVEGQLIRLQHPPSAAVPLHITLGYTHHVNAAYGGTLAARGGSEDSPSPVLALASHARVSHNNFARVALGGESDQLSVLMTCRISSVPQLGRSSALSGGIGL